MSERTLSTTQKAAAPVVTPARGNLLQRACACGQHTIAGGECEECRQKHGSSPKDSIFASDHNYTGQPPSNVDATTDAASLVDGSRNGYDFSRVQTYTDAPRRIQAKLSVSQPTDEYEREADRVADQVMRMPEQTQVAGAQPQQSGEPPLVQRACEKCKDEIHREPSTEEELLEGKEPGRPRGLSPDLEDDIEGLQSGGQPLPDDLLDFFEPRFGQDLSQVRVHTDFRAAQASHRLNAKAFTCEQHIFFGAGLYQPETTSGKRLLAHEITHTIQQQQGVVAPSIMREPAAPARKTGATTATTPGASTQPTTETQTSPQAGGQSDLATRSPARDAHKGSFATETTAAKAAVPEGAGATADAAITETAEATPLETKAKIDTSSSAALLQSLASVSPSDFGQAMTEAAAAVTDIQTQEKSGLQESLPEIEAPSGLPRLIEREPPEATTLEEGKAPDIPAATTREGEPPETSVEEPRAALPAANVPTAVAEPAQEEGGWLDWLLGKVRQFLGTLPTTDPALSTSAGERPHVDTTGDADPAQNEAQMQASNQEVSAKRAEADQAVQSDFGENDIYPTTDPETLTCSYTMEAPEGAPAPGLSGPKSVAETVRSGIDKSAASYLNEEVNKQIEQEQQQRAKYEQDSQAARDDSERQLDDETERVRQEQVTEQTEARSFVADQRQEWLEENRKAHETYSTEVEDKRQEVDEKIDQEVQTAEESAGTELSAAEEEAERERRKAEEEAERKKREAENRPTSFWDDLKGAVSDFFDSVKEAINDLFDELRRRVKQVIEAAKRKVASLIEFARKTIVGLIKGFGEVLKGFVSIALFAFPETAERARQLIDKGVDGAVEVVNKMAEGLTKFAMAVLDALGAALDFILSVYQTVCAAIISVMKFIAIGLVELMKRIGYLVEAAQQMPDHFMGQVQEEIIGRDLGEPLPFERAKPVEKAAAAALAPAAFAAAAGAGGAGAEPLSSEDISLLSKQTFTDKDVSVDQVAPMEVDDEFVSSLGLGEEGEVEFGESDDPANTIAAIQAEKLGEAAPAGGAAQAPATEGKQEETPAATLPEDEATAAPEATGAEPSAEDETERRLKDMMAVESKRGCGKEEAGEAADQSQVPEEAKIGPLTQSQRGRYLLDQMWKGVKQWFDCNWPWLLAGTIVVLVVLIVAEILTGGAITAALPLILELVAIVLLGVALIKMMGKIGEYLIKGWGGDIAGAAKSLANALAIGAIELIFTLLFDLNAIIKMVKSGLKATMKAALATAKTSLKTIARSGKQIGRAAVQTIRHPGRAAALVGRVALRRGKMVFQGLRKGFARGVKSLDELAGRIGKHLRFRKFVIRIKRRRIQLWGYINPWLLLADGTVQQVTVSGGRPLVGEKIPIGKKKGILVGVKDTEASAYVDDLIKMTDAERKAVYKELSGMSEDAIKRAITNRETTRELRKGITGPQPPHFNAHHVVPRELRKNPKVKGFLDEIGFNIEDGARNGLMLPPDRVLANKYPGWGKATLHYTSHSGYTQRMATRLTAIADQFEASIAKGMARNTAIKIANQEVDNLLGGVKSGLMKGAEALD